MHRVHCLELNWTKYSLILTQPAFAAQLNQPRYCILSGPDFWRKIFRCFSVIFSLPLDPNPLTALFGILPESINLNTLQADSVAFATLLARRLILMNEVSSSSSLSPMGFWFLTCSQDGEDSVCNKTKAKTFLKVWSPFLEYLKETTVSEFLFCFCFFLSFFIIKKIYIYILFCYILYLNV